MWNSNYLESVEEGVSISVREDIICYWLLEASSAMCSAGCMKRWEINVDISSIHVTDLPIGAER
jgi:hypothetical protein